MKCDIKRISDKIWQCKICGKVYLADYINNEFIPPFDKVTECRGKVEKPPPLTEKIKNYGKAVKNWARLRFPTRTKEEIESLLNTFCKKCEFYSESTGTCNKCGCNVNSSKIPLINKLAMGSEGCPLKKFLPKFPDVEIDNGE